MEVRGQVKEGIVMRNTLNYNSPNRDSSSKLSSSPAPSLSLGAHNTIFNSPTTPHNQTLNHHHHNHNLSLSHHLPSKPGPNNPDPVAVATSPSTSPIVGGGGVVGGSSNPNPKTTSSVNPVVVAVSSSPIIRYRECLRNHAASSGRHVLDGCGEFMPSGEDGSAAALRCAACECHRNFHRKEIDGDKDARSSLLRSNSMLFSQHYPAPPPPFHHHHHHHHRNPHHHFGGLPATGSGPVQPVMMAFGGGGAESSSEDLNNMFQSNYNVVGRDQQPPVSSSSKKRFRTKFNQEQKDKMLDFAEKLGWRIQKHDEQEVQRFCSDVGVKRQVFKVWMHNNKQSTKKINKQ